MWERPEGLWRRLKLGREEYLQRLITTMIVGGTPPPWNTPRQPCEEGLQFLHLLDHAAYPDQGNSGWTDPEAFVDEYRLPKLDDGAQNGWPDWAVLWSDRAWVIELKTERASHRDGQLPYYLRLATAAHPGSRIDLTYITGRLAKPAPALAEGQRYSHLTWERVLPLLEVAWADDLRPEVVAYVEAVRTVIQNLDSLSPTAQRAFVLGLGRDQEPIAAASATREAVGGAKGTPDRAPDEVAYLPSVAGDLLGLARSTAADGRQRAVGAKSPTDLEGLRDKAYQEIAELPLDDPTRFVLPWLWQAGSTGARALSTEGDEFGYELRFSRYKTMQVKP